MPILVLSWLKTAQECFGNIPSREFQPARIKAVIDAFKLLCAVSNARSREVVPVFVRTYVEQQVGGQLTVNEATLACRAICKTKGVRLGSENRLRHEIKKAIRRYFDVGESHDLILAGRKSQRGFHGLALRVRKVESASTPPSVAGNGEPGMEDTPQAQCAGSPNPCPGNQ